MTPRRAFLVAFVGFFLLGGAWAAALPVNGTYDESQHIVRAYAAVDGQWRPHGPNRQSSRVPASLLPANPDCTHDNSDAYQPASCQRPRPETGRVSTETYVARYNPAYYLAVGLPIRLWPNLTGIVLARLLSALLCALMLAGCGVHRRRARQPLRRGRRRAGGDADGDEPRRLGEPQRPGDLRGGAAVRVPDPLVLR